MDNKPVLLIGLGNPILGDDSVGIFVVRILKQRILDRIGFDFKELSVGGIRLVEEMLGYDTVFVVDSIASEGTSGQIREFSPEDFKESQYESSPHTTNFATALELYKKLEPDRVPKLIRIFTIDVKPDLTFRDALSSSVRTAAEELAQQLVREIEALLK
ncbi:MAG TPA: hydrogenase maturation protease [Terriglobales bacterium]|nr:hydrogenase maturation protease [Terriglobales bacterium]